MQSGSQGGQGEPFKQRKQLFGKAEGRDFAALILSLAVMLPQGSGLRPPQRPALSQLALPLRPPLTGHFCLGGAVAIPRLAGSFKSKRETPHPNTSFCSAGQF